MTAHRRSESTPEGCRALASDDSERAREAVNPHIRTRFELSASVWTARAELLDRLKTDLATRIEAERLGEASGA